jgi:hypothetical protein
MEKQFDPELNLDYHQGIDNSTDIVSTMLGGTVASITDFAASAWNSLPGTEEVATEDLLSKISPNALRVYEEHPDAIHTASFIGGIFVPAGLAAKGLNAYRSGSKAVNFFTKAGKEVSMSKMDDLIREGSAATKIYRQERNAMYAKGLANQVLDATAMEMAIVGTMNAHPFMEDYMKDIGSNFALGVAFGGVVGGAVGHIADRFAVRGLEAAVHQDAAKVIFDNLKTAYQSTQNATQLQVHELNKNALTRIIEGTEYNPVTKELATAIKLKVDSDQVRIFEEMLSPEIKALPTEAKSSIMNLFVSNKGMDGVEGISHITVKKDVPASILGKTFDNLTETLNFTKREIKDKTGKIVKEEFNEAVYLPEFNKYATPSEIVHYTRARDLGKTVDELQKELPKHYGTVPNNNFGEEIFSSSAAQIDGQFVAALNKLDLMDVTDIAKLNIAPDDLPLMNAVLARIAKEPDAFENIKVNISSNKYAFLKETSGDSFTDLSNAFIKKKEKFIDTMLLQGVPLESIAIRTNTPLDAVKAYAATDSTVGLIDVGRFKEYTTAAEIDNIMNASNRALKLTSNLNKQKYTDLKANLDIKTAADLDHELKYIWMKNSNSLGASLIADRILGENKPMLDILRSQISNFINQKAGNKFFQSTDFFVRDMQEAGLIASTIGKNVQGIASKVEEKVLTGIKGHMASIVTDPVALIEANMAINLNASLRGHRIYKDKQFWQASKTIDELGNEVDVLTPVQFQNKEFLVKSPAVDSLLTEMQAQGRELYDMKNVSNKILGKHNLNDIGFWVPPLNPRNKFIAYVHNKIDDTTKMLWANSADELAALAKSYEATIPEARRGKEIKVILPSEKEDYNLLHGRNDALTMEVADTSMLKKGSTSSANIKANADIFQEVAGGYQHYIESQTRHLAELSMSDITDILDRMSKVNKQWFEGQGLSTVLSGAKQPKDTANIIKNTLLGNSNLNEYSTWRSTNQSFETGLSMGMRTVSSVFKNIIPAFGKKGLTEDVLAKADYEKISKDLEKAGVINPWAVFDKEAEKLYNLGKLADHKDSSSRLVYGANAFAATMALRVGELAQPLVNAMSLPILTGLAIANKMPANFMGVARDTAKVHPVQIMYEGMRASNDPSFAALGKRWEELGYFKPMVSEANETLALARGFDPSIITKVEKALDSNIVNLLSKPADWSETLVRRQTMYTGAVLAKRLYPELDDTGVTIFARDFMDRAVGNYHAAQRPVLFQGTLGVALGLFQTYMLTMAQNIYRSLELKDYKALGKAMLTQSTIFGTSSLPGFHFVSEKIGEHFSDNNVDLTTGTYRALPDKMADSILYGLPSNMPLVQPALYTRGELNPRFPGGLTDIVGINFALQAKDSVQHVVESIGNQNQDVGRAMLEALSMQSMSRPIARISEIATGTSVTRQGNTVSTPEEVWTTTGVLSRLLATRPLAEAKLREADHLNRFYGAVDRDNRQEAMMKLKTSIRNGTLNDEIVSKTAEVYFRNGGSPTGWRSAYRQALMTTNTNGKEGLVNRLDDDNPLMHMIDSLD